MRWNFLKKLRTISTGDYDARTFQIKARPEKPIDGFRPGMSVIYKGVEKN